MLIMRLEKEKLVLVIDLVGDCKLFKCRAHINNDNNNDNSASFVTSSDILGLQLV